MTSNNSKIICLIKFGEKKYIHELQEKGSIFMQRLHNYKKISHTEIGDKNEGLSRLFQSKNTTVEVNGEKVETIGNIKIQEENAHNPFIFCSYLLNENCFDNNLNNIIDKRNLNFGNTALLITDMNMFFDKINKKIQSTENLYMDKVNYVNENTFHGKMDALTKFNKYKHQNEHRIILQSNKNKSILKFDIGSIKNISKIYSSKNLLETLCLKKQ